MSSGDLRHLRVRYRTAPRGGTLSFRAAVALTCADIIGSGTRVAGNSSSLTGSAGAALAAWTVAGVIVYVGCGSRS